MVRIESCEYNLAQLNNLEKINGDYFLKTLMGNPNGDFVDDDNPMPVKLPGFQLPNYTIIDVTYPTAPVEVYTYKEGVTTVATITVTFTDSTKAVLLKVERA